MTPAERRVHFREGLFWVYQGRYDRLCEFLPADWGPVEGLRTFEAQAADYAKGRTVAPLGIPYWVTHARAGESPHQYGCASDWTIFDEHNQPVWMLPGDVRWETYRWACSKAGLGWGGKFRRQDRPHNELLLTCDWPFILLAYNKGGMKAAQDLIQESLSA